LFVVIDFYKAPYTRVFFTSLHSEKWRSAFYWISTWNNSCGITTPIFLCGLEY